MTLIKRCPGRQIVRFLLEALSSPVSLSYTMSKRTHKKIHFKICWPEKIFPSKRALFFLLLFVGCALIFFENNLLKSSTAAISSLLRGRYRNERAVCMGRNATAGDLEDILCLPRPFYDPGIKNPCWWENNTGSADICGSVSEGAPGRKLRCLPYFHMLCCSKSGTTDLYNRLNMHPDIHPNSGTFGKEQLYWSWSKYNYGYLKPKSYGVPVRFSQYIEAFDSLAWQIQCNDSSLNRLSTRLITLDGSPPDLWDFKAWPLLPQNANLREPAIFTPHLMQHIYRDPKFIVLMREPVERCYTSYLFEEIGDNPDSFHQDTITSLQTLESCFQNASSRHECYFNFSMLAELKVEVHFMCPVVYIKEWLAVFPRRHFLFMRTESYSKNMQSSLLEVFDFLELSPVADTIMEDMLAAPIAYHTEQKDMAGPMLPETAELLRKFAAPCNAELAQVLGDDIYLWNDVAPPKTSKTLV